MLFTVPELFGETGIDIDGTKAFLGAIESNSEIYIAKGTEIFLPESLVVSGKADLNIYGGGTIRLAPGKDLTFEDCPRIKYSVSTVGNVLPSARVGSFQQVGTSNTVLITLVDNTNPLDDRVADIAGFSVGDAIQTIRRLDNGKPVVAYRGKITSIDGLVLTTTLDNTLGGGITLLKNDQEIVIDSSTSRYCTLNFTRCDGAELNGYHEVGIGATNCKGFTVPVVNMRKAGMSIYYCDGARILSFESVNSPYYGFGAFKSRGIALLGVKSINAGVGGVVIKNCWDFTYQNFDIRAGHCYGLQIRNDTGTVPNLVNPNLQPTLATSRSGAGSRISILDCNLGLWVDDTCESLTFGTVEIVGSISGASLLHDGGNNTSFEQLIIRDHFGNGVPPNGYFTSNAPIRVSRGSGLRIAKLIMNNCLHDTLLLSTTGSSHKNLIIEDSDISECKGTFGFGSVRSGRVVIKCRDPIGIQSAALIQLASTQDFIVEQSSIESNNGGSYSTFISIELATSNVIVRNNSAKSGVVFAGISISENTTGDNVKVHDNSLVAQSQYGITCRGATTRLSVKDNVLQATKDGVTTGPSTPIHTASLTSTDHVIRYAPQVVRASFAAATLAAGVFDSIDVNVPGLGPSIMVEVVITGPGNGQGIQYWGSANSTNNLRIWRRNASAAQISAPAQNLIITLTRVL